MNLDEAIEQLQKITAQVRQASLTDEKTKLGSALALRHEESLINEGTSEFNIVVFGDLNDFKHLNDVYGHEAGNVAISEAGETIQKIIIEALQARAFRPSGDEFVILLKQRMIEEFLSATPSFGNIVFLYKEKELRTAMSFGYAVSDGKTSFSDLLERAESACQHAKVQGDGACVEWTEDIKLNPLVRLPGRCLKCGAKIICNVPANNAPVKIVRCPCCDALL